MQAHENTTSPFLHVYLSPILRATRELLYPTARQEELDSVTDAALFAQKQTTWRLLECAVQNSMGVPLSALHLARQENGKWTSEECFFSLTHTKELAAVALSSQPVGIDMELIPAFFARFANEEKRRALQEKICAAGEETTEVNALLHLWLKKESAYKYAGSGAFRPKHICVREYPCSLHTYENFALALCSVAQAAHFFFWDGKQLSPARCAPIPDDGKQSFF